MMYGHVGRPTIGFDTFGFCDRSSREPVVPEFVGLPFVHHNAPCTPRRCGTPGFNSTRGPRSHSDVAVDAHGSIDNIPVSWVKSAPRGLRRLAFAGAMTSAAR